MTREPSSGTASQEINFWISLENGLDSIDRQLKSDGVTLTLDVLRQAKRFHATVSFIADTGLKEAAEKVQKYNQLMREFPINELLSATSLDRLQEALVLIFGHLTKKLRISPYPIRRALPLVEAISGDLDAQLHNLLSGRRLMHYDYGEFERLMNASDDVFRTWDDQLKDFTNVAREVTRKRSEKFIPIKIVPRHSATQERLQYLRTFRKAHEQLQRTVANVVEAHENATHRRGGDDKGHLLSESFGDMDAVGEVRQAYEALKDVDVLDLSPGKFRSSHYSLLSTWAYFTRWHRIMGCSRDLVQRPRRSSRKRHYRKTTRTSCKSHDSQRNVPRLLQIQRSLRQTQNSWRNPRVSNATHRKCQDRHCLAS